MTLEHSLRQKFDELGAEHTQLITKWLRRGENPTIVAAVLTAGIVALIKKAGVPAHLVLAKVTEASVGAMPESGIMQ